MVKTCHKCHGHSEDYKEANLKRCAGCRKVYYCSAACQKIDWVEHIFNCKPHRPINTADHLALAVRRNQLPVHPQTCEDFGFHYAFTHGKAEELLGLYASLIEDMGVPPKTIYDWSIRGVLVDEIKAAFYKLPEDSRGGSFRWFLQNEHIVAQVGQPVPNEMMVSYGYAVYSHAWQFIGGSEKDSLEQIRDAITSKPKDEQSCYFLYTFLLATPYPNPDSDLWIDFGFASCKSAQENMQLSTQYQRLITQVSFKEFCDAHRARRLLDLFDSKGSQVNRRDHLQDLLHSRRKKLVWYLKQTIVLEGDIREELNMDPMVAVEYGFANCKNDSETRQLKRVYKAFFDTHNGDPLALHDAAIKGNIHGYLSTVVQGLRDSKFRRLMKNPNPLPKVLVL